MMLFSCEQSAKVLKGCTLARGASTLPVEIIRQGREFCQACD